VNSSEHADTSGIVHTIVKKGRVFLLATSFFIAPAASGVPTTVRADHPLDPTVDLA